MWFDSVTYNLVDSSIQMGSKVLDALSTAADIIFANSKTLFDSFLGIFADSFSISTNWSGRYLTFWGALIMTFYDAIVSGISSAVIGLFSSIGPEGTAIGAVLGSFLENAIDTAFKLQAEIFAYNWYFYIF